MIWSGKISKVNETLTLSQPTSNFKYLRVGYSCFGHSLFGLFSAITLNISIREYNCSDEMLAVNFPEIQLTRTSTSSNTYKIQRRSFIYLGDEKNLNDDTENIDNNDWFYINNVYGVGYN